MANLTVPLSSSLPPEVLRALMDKYPQLQVQPTEAESIVNAASRPPTASTAEQAAEVFRNAPANGPGSAAESAAAFERAPIPTSPSAQSVVDSASIPGKSAADSAGVFEQAGAIPGKSAADSATAFAEHGVTPMESQLNSAGAFDSANPAISGASEAAAPIADAANPALLAEKIPNLVADGAGEAAATAPKAAGLLSEAGGAVSGDALLSGASALGKIAGKAALPLTVAQTMLDGPESATSSPMDGPVPGHPGYSFKGQDIVKDPESVGPPKPPMGPPAPGPGDRSTASVKNQAPSAALTPAPEVTPHAVQKAAAAVESSKSKLDPILEQYLKDKRDLADAQDEAKRNRFAAELGGAGATLSHAIAGAKGEADLKPFQQMSENAYQPVADLQAKQAYAAKGLQDMQSRIATQAAMAGSDPNSETSKRTQAVYGPMLKSFGMNPDTVKGLSAVEIKTTMEKPIEFSAKLQELKEAAALRHQQASYVHDDKLRHEDEIEGATIANKANFLSASSRSAVGQAANAKMKLQRLNELLTDPNATPQDMNIAANDLAGAVSGGNATVSGTHGQEYKNLASDLISKANYLMGTTIPAEQSAAKQHMLDVSKRIGSVSDSVIDQNMSIVKAGHAGWFSRHPDQAQNIVSTVANQGATPSPPGAPTAAGMHPQAPTPPTSPAPASAPTPSVAAAPIGTVNIRDPHGVIRHVPQALQAQALANGGTLVP